MFRGLFITGLSLYVISIGVLFILSRQEKTTSSKVALRGFLQYFSLSLLALSFISWLLFYQESGKGHPISTFSETGFLTELFILSSIFLIALVFNTRVISNLFVPIFTEESIKSLQDFVLFLRPFSNDKKKIGRIVKYFSKKTFPAVSIANPHMVVQSIDSDKVFTDDSRWQSAVSDCMDMCRYAILHVGNTEGCKWELEQCKNKIYEKTIFIISSVDTYELLEKFAKELDSKSSLPVYNGGQQAYFLAEPTNLNSWISMCVETKDCVKNILSVFLQNRSSIVDVLQFRKNSAKHPLKSLFNDNCFPKFFGWLSWCGLSLFAFPFMARLKWQYWIVLILLFIVLFVCFETLGIIIMYIIITIFGKRMMWLSGKWSGEAALNRQINLLAITFVITALLSYFMGDYYLSKHPIQYQYKKNYYSEIITHVTSEGKIVEQGNYCNCVQYNVMKLHNQ